MFARHRKLVSLSLVSLDLPLQSSIRTTAILYQKDEDAERCHVLFSEPLLADNGDLESDIKTSTNPPLGSSNADADGDRNLGLAPSTGKQPLETLSNRHLWLEIFPSRAILTMQGNGGFSYRHLWEKGVYGISRYWLQSSKHRPHDQVRLRNFTRSYEIRGQGIPEAFRLEYELWAQKVSLGRYVLSLDVH